MSGDVSYQSEPPTQHVLMALFSMSTEPAGHCPPLSAFTTNTSSSSSLYLPNQLQSAYALSANDLQWSAPHVEGSFAGGLSISYLFPDCTDVIPGTAELQQGPQHFMHQPDI